MAYCIFLFCAHLCAGNLEPIRPKDWVIAKTLIADGAMQNPTIEARFFDVRAAIWQYQRSYTGEVCAPLIIWNST
jgi:hypothetical protein